MAAAASLLQEKQAVSCVVDACGNGELDIVGQPPFWFLNMFIAYQEKIKKNVVPKHVYR